MSSNSPAKAMLFRFIVPSVMSIAVSACDIGGDDVSLTSTGAVYSQLCTDSLRQRCDLTTHTCVGSLAKGMASENYGLRCVSKKQLDTGPEMTEQDKKEWSEWEEDRTKKEEDTGSEEDSGEKGSEGEGDPKPAATPEKPAKSEAPASENTTFTIPAKTQGGLMLTSGGTRNTGTNPYCDGKHFAQCLLSNDSCAGWKFCDPNTQKWYPCQPVGQDQLNAFAEHANAYLGDKASPVVKIWECSTEAWTVPEHEANTESTEKSTEKTNSTDQGSAGQVDADRVKDGDDLPAQEGTPPDHNTGRVDLSKDTDLGQKTADSMQWKVCVNRLNLKAVPHWGDKYWWWYPGTKVCLQPPAPGSTNTCTPPKKLALTYSFDKFDLFEIGPESAGCLIVVSRGADDSYMSLKPTVWGQADNAATPHLVAECDFRAVWPDEGMKMTTHDVPCGNTVIGFSIFRL